MGTARLVMNPMPAAECRASMGLALIFVLRMLKTALLGFVSRHVSTPVRDTTQSLDPVRRVCSRRPIGIPTIC